MYMDDGTMRVRVDIPSFPMPFKIGFTFYEDYFDWSGLWEMKFKHRPMGWAKVLKSNYAG